MIAFGKPIVGPRYYLAAGPSSWYETFPRREADRALTRLLGPVAPGIAVEDYLRRQPPDEEPTWAGLLAHVERLTGKPASDAPPAAIVALWGQIIEAERRPR